MFYNCISLKLLVLSNSKFNICTGDYYHNMFDDSNSIISNFKYKYSNIYIFLEYIFQSSEFLNFSNKIFYYLTDKLFKTKCNLKFIDISNGFSTNFTNVKNNFSNCNSLVSINMTNFSTNCTNMENLFYDFQSLISVDFSNFYSSSNYTNMKNLFYNCISLKSVDFPNFYTSSNYMNLENMFYNCNSLYSSDFSNSNKF